MTFKENVFLQKLFLAGLSVKILVIVLFLYLSQKSQNGEYKVDHPKRPQAQVLEAEKLFFISSRFPRSWEEEAFQFYM